MGTASRPKPKRLAKKLLQIRESLGLSQGEIIRRLGYKMFQGTISAFEHGRREPALPILLSYASLAGICVDVLIDDRLNLPAKLPAIPNHSVRKHGPE